MNTSDRRRPASSTRAPAPTATTRPLRGLAHPGAGSVIVDGAATADEVAALFTARGFVERDRVPYPTFEFGGRKGAAVATVALVARSGGA